MVSVKEQLPEEPGVYRCLLRDGTHAFLRYEADEEGDYWIDANEEVHYYDDIVSWEEV